MLSAKSERFSAQRKDFLEKLENRVKCGVLTPAARDQMVHAIDDQEDGFIDTLKFSAAQVESLLAAVAVLPSGERASGNGRERAANGSDPRVEHAARTREIMVAEKVDFAEASIRALQRDPALRQSLREFRVRTVDSLTESEAA